jgi:5-formyltetrahydrofolate cyclo-ligase
MTTAPPPTGKAGWRAWAAAWRAEGHRIDHAAVVAGVRAFLAGVDGRVLTYRPMAGEVDLDELLVDHRCAVTRTHGGGRLSVHPADGPMEQHRFGYLQPVEGAPELPLDDLAAALVPGVVFDRYGTRLGHGAGHYDRLLPRLRPGIPLVGVTPSALLVGVRLPSDAHDVRMTHLATELGVLPARS